MKRLIVALAFAVASSLANAQAFEIAGVEFQPSVQVGGRILELNGAGVRTWTIFKVYAAGLYVPERADSAAALLEQKGPRLVAITMLRDVDAGAFSGSVSDGLKANHTQQQLAALDAQIAMLMANLKALGDARKGDVIEFEFEPEAGTRIVVNGRQKGRAIEGDAFFTAVLRNWIGDEPVDAGLKAGLIGAAPGRSRHE